MFGSRLVPLIRISATPSKKSLGRVPEANRRLSHVIHFGHNYLVPRWDGTVLVGSTSEFVGYDKRVTASGLQRLLERAGLVVPALEEAEFLDAWAGLRPATADGLPLLGSHPEIEGLIFATGHYRNGVLLTPVTAELIAESILSGRETAELAPFSPARLISAERCVEFEKNIK